MGAWIQALLVRLAMAVLESFIEKGTAKYKKYIELKEELKLNEEKAKKYDKVINDPNSSLEDKLRANDEFGA